MVLEKPFFNTRVKSANVNPKEIILGYLLGPLGALLTSGIFSAMLNTYFTDVLFIGEMADDKVSESVSRFLTLLPLLSIILVVTGNLVVGQLLERTRTMQGKARPWILLSAFTLSAASVLMFITPFQNPIGKMIWLSISYNLFYAVAYPVYITANSTMVAVSTRNVKQRGLLASANNISALAVMGAGTMVFPVIVSMFLGNSRSLWFAAVLSIAVFAALACFLQYFFTRERVTEETLKSGIEKEKTPMLKQIKAVTSDRTWWVIIIFWLLVQVAGTIQNVSMWYFSNWVVASINGDGGLTMAVLSICGAIPMAAAVVIVWPLSNKFGKKNMTVIGLIIGAIGGVLAGLFAGSIVHVAVGIALQCFGASPACYLILAMLADELDHLEAKNGFRCDGLTMSIYSLIAAVSMGAAMTVLNGMLGATGYDASLSKAADGVQSIEVKSAITVGYIWIRTGAFALGAVILLFFNVEKNLKEEHKIILERQKSEALSQGIEWIEPAERLRLEQEEADRIAEQARKQELKSKENVIKKNK